MDYFDADVAYLVGLIVARGQLIEQGEERRILVEFPGSTLQVEGTHSAFDQPTEIKLGLVDIAWRLRNLLETDIDIISSTHGNHTLLVHFHRNNMIWRNLRLILGSATHFGTFTLPNVLFDRDTPLEWKHEFLRGFADVAGNIRRANRYVDGRNRVRLDVLNYKDNWKLPVQLCELLQDHLSIPVQLIAWGHPNMGRDFREHQLNIFAVPFRKIGFTFRHKQIVLEELAQEDEKNFPNAQYMPCPGERALRRTKESDEREADTLHLPPKLCGKHFDAYWQICRQLGCRKRPAVQDISYEEDVEQEVIPE
ncbi:hypothetical protein HRbin15_00772 [bacterium HR15]|nr:hypothetical protein HRbin15_00772 [bacterium HR15]